MNKFKTKLDLHKYASQARAYWFLSIIFACVLFVMLIAGYRIAFSKANYVYARVKVSQGLWWAGTQRAPAWFIPALKKGQIENSLFGRASAEILEETHYPYYGTSQYDIYLTLKLRVTGNKQTGTYNYNRQNLAVGSPIEFSFPEVEISGVVIALSPQPFKDRYVQKIVTIVKSNALSWEVDSIHVGDKYYNGERKVLEVIEKNSMDKMVLQNNQYINNGVYSYIEPEKVLIVKVKLNVSKKGNRFIYAEEQELKIAKTLNISTDQFVFQDFLVQDIN